MVLESDGTGSVLNVSALTGFTEANGWTTSTLQASNGGTVNDSSLASLSNVNVNIAGSGENLTLGCLTSYGSGNITVSGGATLSLPGLTSYTGNGGTTTLEATGTGSVLTLANLATMTESANNYRRSIQFEALAGGTVTLSALEDDQHRHGGPGERRQPTASLNVSALTGFTEANGWTTSTLQASNGGTVSDGSPDQPVEREPHDRRHGHHRHGPAHVVRGRVDLDQRRFAELRRADVVQWQQSHGQRRRDREPARGHQLHRQRRARPRSRPPARAAR